MIGTIVVDDEREIREGLCRQLQCLGLPISVCGAAKDGAEALRLAREQRPGILLVDINMPQMDGLEFIEAVKAQLPDSQIVIISGYDQFDYARSAVRLGVLDYLLKPVSNSELYIVMRKAIDRFEGLSSQRSRMAPAPEAGGQEDPIDAAIAMMHMRFSDPGLSASAVAESLFLSVAQLSRGLKQRTGCTFSEYLYKLRMEQAMYLLSSTKPVTVYGVAGSVGYSSQHYFCRMFKAYTGCTPSEFRSRAVSKEKNPGPEGPSGEL